MYAFVSSLKISNQVLLIFKGQKANELNTLNNAKQVLSMQTVKDSFNLLENVDNITSTGKIL